LPPCRRHAYAARLISAYDLRRHHFFHAADTRAPPCRLPNMLFSRRHAGQFFASFSVFAFRWRRRRQAAVISPCFHVFRCAMIAASAMPHFHFHIFARLAAFLPPAAASFLSSPSFLHFADSFTPRLARRRSRCRIAADTPVFASASSFHFLRRRYISASMISFSFLIDRMQNI